MNTRSCRGKRTFYNYFNPVTTRVSSDNKDSLGIRDGELDVVSGQSRGTG